MSKISSSCQYHTNAIQSCRISIEIHRICISMRIRDAFVTSIDLSLLFAATEYSEQISNSSIVDCFAFVSQ